MAACAPSFASLAQVALVHGLSGEILLSLLNDPLPAAYDMLKEVGLSGLQARVVMKELQRCCLPRA
jgi:hypothetical protein